MFVVACAGRRQTKGPPPVFNRLHYDLSCFGVEASSSLWAEL